MGEYIICQGPSENKINVLTSNYMCGKTGGRKPFTIPTNKKMTKNYETITKEGPGLLNFKQKLSVK